MPQYVMFLWENPASFANVSPGEMQGVIQEYVAWRTALAAKGQLRASAKLRDEGGKRITGGSRPTISDGPYAEAHEVIGGLFTIDAADYQAAAAVASSCPHIKYGWIELREVEPT
jgi:hypothetical protein